MPANHCQPHTDAAKAKMRAAHLGKPAPWKQRPQIQVAGVTHYRCARCGGFFPKEGFHTNKRTVLGIKTECKPCHNATSIASRDPENKRAKGVIYEATRRARAAGSTGTVRAEDWSRLLNILGRNCLHCGSDAPPTQDHITPLAKGGAHHPTNLQPLCRPCNERKQAREIDYRNDAQRATVAAVWVIEFKRVPQ